MFIWKGGVFLRAGRGFWGKEIAPSFCSDMLSLRPVMAPRGVMNFGGTCGLPLFPSRI